MKEMAIALLDRLASNTPVFVALLSQSDAFFFPIHERSLSAASFQ